VILALSFLHEASAWISLQPRVSIPVSLPASIVAPLSSLGPSWDWQSVAETVFENQDTPILLFDGVCNFCNDGVNQVIDWDTEETLRFCSLQSATGQALLMQAGKEPNDLSSIVLYMSPDEYYFESEAVLRLAQMLRGLPDGVRAAARVSQILLPSLLRDGIYHLISENRHFLNEGGPQCRLDFDGTLEARFLRDPDWVPAGISTEEAAEM